jgi:hypothetical protein
MTENTWWTTLPPDPAEGTDFNHCYGVYYQTALPGGRSLEPVDGQAICGATVDALVNYPGKSSCPVCDAISFAFIADCRRQQP